MSSPAKQVDSLVDFLAADPKYATVVQQFHTHAQDHRGTMRPAGQAMNARDMQRLWKSLLTTLRPGIKLAIFIEKDESIDAATIEMIADFIATHRRRVHYLSFMFDSSSTTQAMIDRLDVPRLKLRGIELYNFGVETFHGTIPSRFTDKGCYDYYTKDFDGVDYEEDSNDGDIDGEMLEEPDMPFTLW